MEFSWKEQTFDFTKIQDAQKELAKLEAQIRETSTALTSLQEETQQQSQLLEKFIETGKEKEHEVALLCAQIAPAKTKIAECEAQLVHIQAEVEKHNPVLVKIAEDNALAEKLDEAIKHKTHALKIQTKQEEESYKRLAELEQKLKPKQAELDSINESVAHNTKLLKLITWEREQNESLKNEIADKLATLQIDQKNMSQYIRPIQKKLDKAGIKIDFLKFIQDI